MSSREKGAEAPDDAAGNAGEEARHHRLNHVLREILEAQERGECPDRGALIRRHPEFHSEIAEFLELQAPLRAELGGPLPRKFGGYELLELLGQGGMGIVYKARQESPRRIVALKIQRDGPGATRRDRDRFRFEYEAVASLEHPHIVKIYEVGEHDGSSFYSMQYIQGGSLSAHRHSVEENPKLIAGIIEVISRAVHHAHDRGILHRDIKPGNILMDSAGKLYLTDFGLASRMDGNAFSRTGAALGTVGYMAPEHLGGKRGEITRATDVYGLGAVLYAMLCGETRHESESDMDTYEKLVGEDVKFPAECPAVIPKDLKTICLTCLEREPSRRYSTAEELADDLKRYLEGRTITARPAGWIEKAVKWARRKPALAALVLMGVLSLCGYLYILDNNAKGIALTLDRVRDENRLGQRFLYAHELTDACRAVESFEYQTAWSLMRALRPLPDGEELRGFEFFHNAKRSRQMLQVLPQATQQVTSVVFSRDGLMGIVVEGRYLHVVSTDDVSRNVWPTRDGWKWHRAVFSPDSKQVTLSSGRDIQAFETSSGEESWRPWTAVQEIQSLAYSPDGNLVTGSKDGVLEWWSPGQPQPVRALLAHRGAVADIVFLGSGDVFATAGRDGLIHLWRSGANDSQATLQGHTGAVNALAASPDGGVLFSAGADGKLLLWRLEPGGDAPEKLHQAGQSLDALAVSSSGELLAAAGAEAALHVFALERIPAQSGSGIRARGMHTYRGHVKKVNSIAFLPGTKRIVTGSDEGCIYWDAGTLDDPQARDEPFALAGHGNIVWQAVYHPTGNRFYTADENLVIREWNVDASGDVTRVTPGRVVDDLRGEVDNGVMLSPDVEWCLTKLPGEKTGEKAGLWRLGPVPGRSFGASFAGELEIERGPLMGYGFSSDGTFLGVASSDDGIRLWKRHGERWEVDSDLLPPSRPRRKKGPIRTDTIVFSKTNALVALSGRFSDEIALWRCDRPTDPPILLDCDGDLIVVMAFSPDSTQLVAAGQDRVVRFFPLEEILSGRRPSEWGLRVLRGHRRRIASLGFTLDGKHLVTGSDGGELRFWDYVYSDGRIRGKERGVFSAHAGSITTFAFSPDMSCLATGGGKLGAPGEVRFWRRWTDEKARENGM